MWTRSHRSSIEGGRRACLLVLFLALPAASQERAPADPVPAAVAARARQALSDPRFQRRMPERTGAAGLPPAPRRSASRLPRITLPLLGVAASVVQLVFFVLLAVVVVVVALWLVSEMRRRRIRSARAVRGVEDSGAAAGEGSLPSLEEASRLAGEARYGEAIHVLLLATFGQLAVRARRPLPPHWTSREALRALPLGPETQGTLRELVASVEGWLFGGLPVPAEEYERCRERYLRLTGGGAP